MRAVGARHAGEYGLLGELARVAGSYRCVYIQVPSLPNSEA